MKIETKAQLIKSIEHPFPVYHYRWPNGLTLLYQPDHGAPIISYQTWVKVGSAHERQGKTGIAHFFEHLMFKETTNYSDGEFDRILEEVGGEVNAATWLDWTYYYADLPSEHLEKIVKLEADRLVNLALNTEVLEAERQVVMNERRECVEDDPSELMSEYLWYNLMGEGHPYAHSTIGWMSDISKLSLEDCQAFYQSYYSPNQIVLVVSGDADSNQLLSLIDRHYGEIPSSDPVKSLIYDSNHTPKKERGCLELKLELHAPRLHLGFRVPSITDSHSVALECLDELLFEGDSSRLYKKLVYDMEVASYVYSMLPQFRGEAVYEIGVELLPTIDPNLVIDEIMAELMKIANEGVTVAELQRVKLSKELNNYRCLQTVQQRAQSLGFWQITADDFTLNFSRLGQIDQVSSNEVKQIAQHMIQPELSFVVIGLPTH